jgi:hypothetical protein
MVFALLLLACIYCLVKEINRLETQMNMIKDREVDKFTILKFGIDISGVYELETLMKNCGVEVIEKVTS